MHRLDDVLRHTLLENGQVLRVGDHPELASTIQRRVAAGRLTSVLPGTLVPTPLAHDPVVRARAAMAWSPDAVVCGDAAARLSFWPELGDDLVLDLAVRRTPRCLRPGFQLERRMIAPELIVERDGIRLTAPALTALDLCAERDGDGIDRVLFRRAATLSQLHQALELTPGRRGNRERRALLLDSRDEPYARSERLAHRLLREAGITGWKANLGVVVDQTTMFLDVGFERIRLAIEIDGFTVHTEHGTFEHDRWRQNLLVNAGWHVLRFTWRMVVDDPATVVRTIREAIEMLTGNGLSRGLGGRC